MREMKKSIIVVWVIAALFGLLLVFVVLVNQRDLDRLSAKDREIEERLTALETPISIDSVWMPDSLFALPDTHYQESQQRWRWEEEEKKRRCQEIWECVREKLED